MSGAGHGGQSYQPRSARQWGCRISWTLRPPVSRMGIGGLWSRASDPVAACQRAVQQKPVAIYSRIAHLAARQRPPTGRGEESSAGPARAASAGTWKPQTGIGAGESEPSGSGGRWGACFRNASPSDRTPSCTTFGTAPCGPSSHGLDRRARVQDAQAGLRSAPEDFWTRPYPAAVPLSGFRGAL